MDIGTFTASFDKCRSRKSSDPRKTVAPDRSAPVAVELQRHRPFHIPVGPVSPACRRQRRAQVLRSLGLAGNRQLIGPLAQPFAAAKRSPRAFNMENSLRNRLSRQPAPASIWFSGKETHGNRREHQRRTAPHRLHRPNQKRPQLAGLAPDSRHGGFKLEVFYAQRPARELPFHAGGSVDTQVLGQAGRKCVDPGDHIRKIQLR